MRINLKPVEVYSDHQSLPFTFTMKVAIFTY